VCLGVFVCICVCFRLFACVRRCLLVLACVCGLTSYLANWLAC